MSENLAIYLAVIALILAVAGLAYGYVRLNQERRRLAVMEEAYQRDLQALRADLAGLCNGAMHMGDRLVKVEHDMGDLHERQEKLSQQNVGGDSPFGPAIRMVQGGAGIEDIMDTCGLSKAEAQLLHRMHCPEPGKAANGE